MSYCITLVAELVKPLCVLRPNPSMGKDRVEMSGFCPRTGKYTIISPAVWHDVAAEELQTKTNVAAKNIFSRIWIWLGVDHGGTSTG